MKHSTIQGFWIFGLCSVLCRCGYPSDNDDTVSSDLVKEKKTDTDSDVQKETDTTNRCDYGVSYIGDICDLTCGEDAICGEVVYPKEREYIENYCYPRCSQDYGESRCQCDDICVVLDETDDLAVCLADGRVNLTELSLAFTDVGVLPGNDVVETISSSQITAFLGNEDIAFSGAYGWFLEGDLFGQGDRFVQKWAVIAMYAPKDEANAWVLELYLNEHILEKGGTFLSSQESETTADHENTMDGGIDSVDAGMDASEIDDVPQVNWFAQLLSFEDIDSEGRPDRVYSEGKLSSREENVVTIHEIGSPCTESDNNCKPYQFSVDLEFFAIRSEVAFE